LLSMFRKENNIYAWYIRTVDTVEL
jgi:hypothetical protein